MSDNVSFDFSYGIIPVSWEGKRCHVFLLKHIGGHWGFPKGHPEEGETPLEAASRELFEETGLRVKKVVLDHPTLEENYSFSRGNEIFIKKVRYFVAEVESPDNVVIESDEAIEGKWVDVNEAPMHLTFAEGKKMCRFVAQALL